MSAYRTLLAGCLLLSLGLPAGRAQDGPAVAPGGYGLTNGSAAPPLAPVPPVAPPPSLSPDRPVNLPAPPDLSPWAAGDRLERAPKKGGGTSAGEWGTLTAQTSVQDGWAPAPWDEPLWKRTWQTDESYKLALAGPLFVFGQVGANSDEAAQANMKVATQTGLACKLPLGQAAELQVRGGPRVTYTDPLRPDRTSQHSDWLLEVQARVPLLARVGLEYQGSAAPALTPLDHDWINQDIHLAIPVGTSGKLQLGAKHKWQSTDARTGTDSTQLYMGLELAR